MLKPFIYLIQRVSGNSLNEITDPSCDLIVLNRQEPELQKNVSCDTASVKDVSWSEGRNLLLWQALELARVSGNDYLYYIFLDDDCVLQEDRKLARHLDIPLTGNPFRTFERFLLEWEPAVGYARNDRHYYEEGRAVNLGHAFDGSFNAFHRETLSFLLPYYTGFDSESWLYAQHIINHMVSLHYHLHRIQCNVVTTTRTGGKRFGPRKKYWEIPTTFLAYAIKQKLRRRLNTLAPDSPLPAPGRPRKKDCSYRRSHLEIAEHWHMDHPLIRHRRIDDIKPRPPQFLKPSARVAVCLSGRCSGLDQTYQNLQENVLRPLAHYGHVDLFMYVPDDTNAEYSSILNPTVLQVVPDHHLDEGNLQNGRDCQLKVGIQRYLQQLYGLKMCDQLRQTYEKENGIHYDAVLRCRPDLFFESALRDLTTLDLNYIHVPDFHMFEGCNDRFAFGNSENMAIYMKKYDDWHGYVRAWISAGPAAPPVTAEMFTGGQLRQYGIDVRLLPVRFNRVRYHKVETDWEDHQRKVHNKSKTS
jgi:hypothetical protein